MKYKVTVKNSSEFSGSVFLYQMIPGQIRGGSVVSLVWMSASTGPGISCVFRWDDELEFSWCETRVKPSGQEIDAYATMPVKCAPGYCANLSRMDGAYQLLPSHKSAPPGYINIFSDESVPSGNVRAGLGMNGFPTVVMPCSPGLELSLPTQITFWICCGDSGISVPGHIIPDPALPHLAVSRPAQLVFPQAVQGLYAYFNENNSWKTEPDYS